MKVEWATCLIAAVALTCGVNCIPSGKPSPGGNTATQGGGLPVQGGAAPRNPFGMTVEPVPDDAEVKAFARTVTLAGGPKDANAEPWGIQATGQAGSLDGEWSGRWKYQGADKPWVPQTKPT